MIKIPERKYMPVQKLHVGLLKQPVNDSIQFYLNCCDILSGTLNFTELNRYIKMNKSKMKSLLTKVSTKKYKELQNIQEVFDNRDFEAYFLTHCSNIRNLLAEMLDPTSVIYFECILSSEPTALISAQNYLTVNYSMLKTASGEDVFKPEITNKGSVFKILEGIYNYDDFRDGKLALNWGAYNLCEELDINVCPYCNRIYTFTVVNSKKEITRPELDHYFPRSRFPLFAISFYNLIPSCKVCNSNIKKNDYLNIDDYLHPYINSLSPAYRFDFLSLDLAAAEGKNRNNKIFINQNGVVDTKSDKFLDKFLIEDIYERHKNVIPIFINKHKHYPDSVISEIAKLLSVQKEELLLSLYNPAQEEEIINTSLGKFTRDLYLKFRDYYNL
ncbi:HNH endonuclease [Niallia sp. FSL R7-0271]|uniref:HNH endonuclease n=1 Tax=Niallia sp. FSL R7-0271 TaxID=2921678 RepID=UPI0030F975E4